MNEEKGAGVALSAREAERETDALSIQVRAASRRAAVKKARILILYFLWRV
jgi:hypothetical protein